MGRIGLHPGSWLGAISLVFGGLFEVMGAGENQQMLADIGWVAIILGIFVLVWGVTLNGEHWWRKFLPNRLRNPVGDCGETTAQDNRRGNFNEGTVHGGQHYHEKPAQRHIGDSFAQTLAPLAESGVVIRTRSFGDEHEKKQFEETLVRAIKSLGIDADTQGNFANGETFAGIRINPSANRASRDAAEAIRTALQGAGIRDVKVLPGKPEWSE